MYLAFINWVYVPRTDSKAEFVGGIPPSSPIDWNIISLEFMVRPWLLAIFLRPSE